jgi:hypothetical protein
VVLICSLVKVIGTISDTAGAQRPPISAFSDLRCRDGTLLTTADAMFASPRRSHEPRDWVVGLLNDVGTVLC